jgi:hypothetical protein
MRVPNFLPGPGLLRATESLIFLHDFSSFSSKRKYIIVLPSSGETIHCSVLILSKSFVDGFVSLITNLYDR